jgi:hypothetical protein
MHKLNLSKLANENMILIQKFELSKNISLELLMPSLESKFNYFQEPTEKLHMADQAFVRFKENNKEISIGENMIDTLLDTFRDSFKSALNGTIVLPEDVKVGTLGYHKNINIMDETADLLYCPDAWLCSGDNVEAWIYNEGKKIFLEISPDYPWLYSDLDEAKTDSLFVPFESFIKQYKPIFVQELPKKTVAQWLIQCEEVIAKLDRTPPQEGGIPFRIGRPVNGQAALDNSLAIEGINLPHRIAVHNHEFVILNQISSSPLVYHGHVRLWRDLTEHMQATFKKANLVTAKGKIK